MPSVDDVAKDLEETLAMFENAYTSGVTDIILTPHYIKGTKYEINNEQKEKITNILREALRRTDMDINIYYGNEVYIDNDLVEMIKDKKVATLANSRYVLVELPVNAMDNNAGNVFFNLRSNGYIPIIAHPERYIYFQKHPEKVMDYIKLGCLLQGDYMSLLGKYGKKAKKTLKILLKNGVIKFMSSDIHHSYNDYHIPEAEKRTLKIVKDENIVNKLFVENPESVINDKIIR
jgi:protein-tyrosine phosphatase